MSHLFRFTHLRWLLVAILLNVLVGCQNESQPQKANPAFSQYISGFTSGVVSKKSVFRIRLSKASKEFTALDEKVDGVFEFNPEIKGNAYWVDNQTIDFRPDELLQSGTKYAVEFKLGELLDVEREFQVFKYQLETVPQHFTVNVEQMKPYVESDLGWNELLGTVQSADYLDSEEVTKLISAEQNGKKLNLRWIHHASGRQHQFFVDSVLRSNKASFVDVEWDGSLMGLQIEDAIQFEIPALSDFKLMQTRVVQSPEQYVVLHFSSPLDKNQNLDGLIHFEQAQNLKFEVDGNTIKAYPSNRMKGTQKLVLESGIKNIMGYSLPEKSEMELTFIEVKPEVRIHGTGTILPSTDGLVLPFEAVNLKAVDVTITKVFENNVHQFFQTNRVNGNKQMARVGKKIIQKKVNLVGAPDLDFGVWNNFTLDLSDLISADPGAIYRVKLDYRQSYSLYNCPGTDPVEEPAEPVWEEENEDWSSYEEEYSDYYYYDDYYYEDYNYNERNNPCHSAYYSSRHGVSKNIFASNLGLIVKRGVNNQLFVVVTDLRTTKPISGARVAFYDFQNQLLGEEKTDREGRVEMDLESKPFLLVATAGKDKGYLKLDDGSALSLSQFNVRGEQIQKGVKGFIYGERGVWRPGDTLFLSFILEDKNNILPKNHPVHFELSNPQGKVTHRLVQNQGLHGFHNFTVATDQQDLTGNWTARVKVGGAVFSKKLKIEAIKPNRLKIKMDFGVDMLSAENPNVKGVMEAKWLHGAKARGLKAKVGVTLVSTTTRFSAYPDFHFTDPARQFTSEEQVVFEGRMNEEGVASISSDIKVHDVAPGMLNAFFVTRVFEESGDFSIDRFSIPYSPFKRYVGIRTPEGDSRGTLLTDTVHNLEIVTLSSDGKPVAVSNLEVKVFKLNWRWWWDASSEYLGNYVGSSYRDWVQTGKVSTNSQGKGRYGFKIQYPDWGRYMVRVTDRVSGHSAGKIVYVDWPGWVGRSKKDNPGGATMLSFSSDKEEYQVGEQAHVSIPAGGEGRALITVETGSKVLSAKWVEVTGNEILHSIPVTPEMAPNCYVHVSLLQPHQHNNNLPLRMYGVIPLKVEDPGTHLHPEIQMPDELKPESQVKIKVSEKNGKKMTYTLAVVDDGLLDLTRFKTPNAHPVFYAHEALGVKTWDLYDFVIGAYGGQLERLLAIGGDEGIHGKDKEKINRFKPMVRFIGPFELAKGKTQEHTIDIPNYIGSVRTMVVAGYEGAYGKAEKTTPVKTPLMVLATLPRVLGPSEKVKLPVTVFAMEPNMKMVEVEVQTNALFANGKTQKKTIEFTEPGDQVVNFDLELAPQVGKGTVRVVVKSGRERAQYDIEIEVRNPNPEVSRFQDLVLNPGESKALSYKTFGLAGTNGMALEFSSVPPIDFKRRLKYLIGYPHGCIEQTTSKAFPQLYLTQVMEVEEKVKERTSDNVKSALKRIHSFQYADGGFSYWPGGNSSSDWGTSYAGHFMLEAEAQGYQLPMGMKSQWIQYQSRAARMYRPTITKDSRGIHMNHRYDFAQAYRLFTLALAGSPELGAMNRLRTNNQLDVTGKWRLAAAYYLAGQPEIARELVDPNDVMVTESGNDSYTYGSAERDRAMILESMSIMGMRTEALSLVKSISKALSQDRWMSTQTTAYCLLSMVKYMGEHGVSKTMDFNYTMNGKKEMVKTINPLKQINWANTPADSGNIQIENNVEGILFARLVTTGIPPQGQEESSASGISLSIRYTTMQGKALDVSQLPQGTDFMATVTISHRNENNYLKDLALTHVFPSGWEIHNARMDEVASVHQQSAFDYQDIRDDRVYTYFGLSPYFNNRSGHTKTFVVTLNAAYLGNYYLPAVQVESMYDNRISAKEKGQWVRVVKPGE